MIPVADLTASATLVLAGITLALVIATVALVIVTRSGTAQARADARAELDLLRRQFGAEHRPLLVDVLLQAPVPADISVMETGPGPRIGIQLPGMASVGRVDPRAAFVLLDGGRFFVSIPLRNVGKGLAVIDGSGVVVAGEGAGALEYRTIHRYHVPVNETTRVDLVVRYLAEQAVPVGTVWELRIPYTDVAGEQRTVAMLRLVRRGEEAFGPWRVERVDHDSVADGSLS